MSNLHILDASALIALLTRGDGADVVRELLRSAYDGETLMSMHKLNLLEVYYADYREHGGLAANEMLGKIKKLPLTIIPYIDDEVFDEAGRLKASYKISFPDSVALAVASAAGASLVTCDHSEFDFIEKKESIKFHWIR